MTSAILSFLFLFTATTAATPQRATKEVALDKEFEIRLDEEVSFKVDKGLKIIFSSVAEDSRCPTGVQCVWAGNAKVVLFVRNLRRRAYYIKLNTGVEPKQDNFIMKYDIKLVSLSPYPKEGVTIKKRDYVATLLVTRRHK